MASHTNAAKGPHQGLALRFMGEPLDRAQAAMILLHGRGATAADILTLVPQIDVPGFAYLAPEASDNVWYPERFSAPIASNEPWLSSALTAVADALARVAEAGIPLERTMLLGFSQGACLTLEFAARNARRYGGVFGLTGALIGPADTPRNYPGNFAGTPVFIGGSDVDIHVPKERMLESGQVVRKIGGQVTVRFYSNLGHQVNQDEIDFVRGVMAQNK